MNRILIVRMSALGDIVHALPVLAALRAAYPAAEIDWLVDQRYAGVLDLVDGVTRRIIGRPHLRRAIGALRARRYDVAMDLQGLLKSAVMARLSGARRVIGFHTPALRERSAALFYGETAAVAPNAHIIAKNLSVLPLVGIRDASIRFPFRVPESRAADAVAAQAREAGSERFALINAGAAWPNKRWPADRFGAVAERLRERHGLPSFVLWGYGEEMLADAVVAASGGAAARAPETSLGDLLAIASRAALMISGDTGPVHLAAAMRTPVVGIYGPTWPERNGPWDPDDVVVSRAAACVCHHKRQCLRLPADERWKAGVCLMDIGVGEVADAIDRRLARAAEARG
jgi:lipopolysaccharide heptosyltransferase I